MKIALFLDVDKTLTMDYVQGYYAAELGCKPDYEKLENDLDAKRITSAEFGKRIITLFASKNLTKAQAKQIATRVELRDWAKSLLSSKKTDIYLVSSGPSYYVDELIREYGIPDEHALCSRYGFSDDNGVIVSCDAVDAQQKQSFVMDHAGAYDITIGVGDHPISDGPFVGACTIPLLLEPYAGFLHVDNFSSVTLLIDKLLKASPGVASVSTDILKNMNLSQIFKAFTLGVWATFLSALLGAGAIGVAIARYSPSLFK